MRKYLTTTLLSGLLFAASANVSAWWGGWNPYSPVDPRYWLEEFFGGGWGGNSWGYNPYRWGYGGPWGGYGYPGYAAWGTPYGYPYHGGWGYHRSYVAPAPTTQSTERKK